jgi:Uma2 family endonuclease
MTLLHAPVRKSEFQRHPNRRMTAGEFDAWIGEKTRAEWVDGEVIMMAPVSTGHDHLGWWLRSLFQLFAERHGFGDVFGSEVIVHLSGGQRRMPDVSFVAAKRREIVHPNHIAGAPDLVMEVVSPDSVARDWRDKFSAYQSAGVKEYWIVDPLSKRMEAHRLGRGRKFAVIDEKDGAIHSTVLPGFYLKTEWLFGDERPSVLVIARELKITN